MSSTHKPMHILPSNRMRPHALNQSRFRMIGNCMRRQATIVDGENGSEDVPSGPVDRLPERAVSRRHGVAGRETGEAVVELMITHGRMFVGTGGLVTLVMAGHAAAQTPTPVVPSKAENSIMDITRSGSQPSRKGP